MFYKTISRYIELGYNYFSLKVPKRNFFEAPPYT